MKAFVLSLLVLMCAATASAASAAPMSAAPYQRSMIREARALWGLNAPVAIMAGQIEQESAWNPQAQSPFAMGLAQFTPSTAQWISGAFPGTGVPQPTNPEWAIRALVRYDFWLAARTGADDECTMWAMALSGYNGGLGWLQRDKQFCQADQPCDPGLWFGNVELHSTRSPAAMLENRMYPRLILLKRQFNYLDWGRVVPCSVSQGFRAS